jgi:hypothetical protein
VLGRAGWYSIKPAPEYRALFAQGMEKAELWSFVDDTYLDSFTEGKKIRGTMDSLVMEYYKEHRSPTSCPDLAAAWRVFERHHRFLIVKMLEKFDMRDNWAQTPVYQYCVTKYPAEVREVKEILQRQKRKHNEAKEVKSPPPSPSQASTPTSAPTSESTSRPSRRKSQIKKESPTPTPIPAPTPKRPNAQSWSRIVYKFLENYICTQSVPARDVTIDKLAEILYENFEIESQPEARDMLAVRAGDLCLLMEESQRYQWENRRAFMQLQKATMPANAKLLLAIRPSRRASIHNRIAVVTGLPPPPQPSPEIKREHPRTGGKGRKSGRIKHERISPDDDLQPLPQPSSPPSTSPSVDALASSLRRYSSSPESHYDEPPPSLIPYSSKGKGKCTLRPVETSITHPPSSPLEPPDSDSDSNPFATRFANLKRALDGPSSSQSYNKRMRTEESSFSPPDSPLPVHWPDIISGRGRPQIQVMKLPDTTTIVGGVWRCPMDGCTFKVLDADTPEGKVDIEVHYAEHGQAMRDAMETIGVEIAPRQGRNVGYVHLLPRMKTG